MKSELCQTVHGAPSYGLQSKEVRLWITQQGGHLGPVEFRLGRRWVQPFSLAPWTPAECEKNAPPILKVLRGDFFCLPFGERAGQPPHGEPANAVWTLEESTPHELRMRLALKAPRGLIEKRIQLRPGHCAVYQEHRISGLSGHYGFGLHAILDFQRNGPGRIATSPIRFAAVMGQPYGNPAAGEYTCLRPGARFQTLKRVPLANGGWTDLTVYPAREGFEDFVLVSNKPGELAWTAVTFHHFIWLSLKDPSKLANTMFWISNGGRHMPPWNGKHRARMGIEEIMAGFPNSLGRPRTESGLPADVPTGHTFSKKQTLRVAHIHLVIPVEPGFGRVTSVKKSGPDQLKVQGEAGQTCTANVDWKFLYEG